MEGPAASIVLRESRPAPGPRPLPASYAPPTRVAVQPARPQPMLADWLFIGILLCLSLGIRVWLISHTVVAARDSIGFIRYALQLERESWVSAVRAGQQHPGYPLHIMVVSWPVRAIMGGITPQSMQMSAQITSALAGILLVLPMFFLGKELFGSRAAFWGTAWFLCVPNSARILSDGLSEATFLFYVVWALLFAAQALRTGSWPRFALCGLSGGMAYLTRPEGALVVLATASVYVGMQALPGWRRGWGEFCSRLAILWFCAIAVACPYFLVTGQFTTKQSPNQVLDKTFNRLVLPAPEGAPATQIIPPRSGLLVSGNALFATLFAINAPEDLQDRSSWAVRAVGEEILKAYQYVIGLPLLLGLWWFRQRLKNLPGVWVMVALCTLQVAVLCRLAMVMGYVSDRHVLLFLICGVFTWAAALLELGPIVWSCLVRVLPRVAGRLHCIGPCGLMPVLLTALLCSEVLELNRPMHTNRAGHRAAGEYLAQHARPFDDILDPFCWAHYYAGRVFVEHARPEIPPGIQAFRYVILENTDNEHIRLPLIAAARQLAAQGMVVYQWPSSDDAKVAVYKVPYQNPPPR